MINTISTVLLMAGQQGADGKASNPFMSMLPLLLIIVVFYFFMIRPQMRKNKAQKQFRESLKKGDRIITIGGIHGKIIEVNDTTFIIETEGLGKLKIERSAVALNTVEPINEK